MNELSPLAASLTGLDLVRFLQKIDCTGECYVWTGYRGRGGYGQLTIHRRRMLAHRFAYELAGPSIPDGLTIDHLCRNPSCVRPSHLEAVPIRDNVLRGTGPTAVNARKTHCPKGHVLTIDNTYTYRGQRRCASCMREHQRRYRARRLS